MTLANNVFTLVGAIWLLKININKVLENALITIRNGHSRLIVSIVMLTVMIGTLYGPFVSIAAAPISEAENSIEAPLDHSFQAVVTQYSRADSCHNMVKGKCLMASGKAVYLGAAACPKFLELGTKIIVAGKTYTCEDRYSSRLDDIRGYPTIDIFVDSYPHGNQIDTISVIWK